jgi:hypothetical protein
MPLTQARYLSLLSACDAYEAWIAHIRQIVRTNDDALRASKITVADAYNALANVISEEALPPAVIRSVAAERAHFLATSHRNDHVREYRRRLRAGESTIGITEPANATPAYTPTAYVREPVRDGHATAESAATRNPQLTEEFLASVREGVAAELAGQRQTILKPCARWCGHNSGYRCLLPDSLHYRCVKDPGGETRAVEPAEPESVDTATDF